MARSTTVLRRDSAVDQIGLFGRPTLSRLHIGTKFVPRLHQVSCAVGELIRSPSMLFAQRAYVLPLPRVYSLPFPPVCALPLAYGVAGSLPHVAFPLRYGLAPPVPDGLALLLAPVLISPPTI